MIVQPKLTTGWRRSKDSHWIWKHAEREYERAIELNPNFAAAHNGYAVYLTLMNRRDEAVEEIKRARELNPLSLPINTNVVYTLYFTRRDNGAFEPIRITLELNPNYPTTHSIIAAIYEGKGMYSESVAAYSESCFTVIRRTAFRSAFSRDW